MHYLLLYDYSPDYLTRRSELRGEHLRLAWESQARGEMLLGGALDDPLDAAAMLFQCETTAAVEAFVAADPYVRHGLVLRWRIRPWHTVVGEFALNPTWPD